VIPAARPLLTDRDAYSGGADLRDTIRRLIAWEQFTYARDCAFVPGQPDDGLYTGGTAEQVENWVAPADGEQVMGTIYVPESLGLSQTVELRFYVRAPAGCTLTLKVAAIAGGGGLATVSSTAFTGWVSLTVRTTGPAVLQIRGTATGGTCNLDGAAGWWRPAEGVRDDVTIQAGATPFWISQTWAADGRPDATYLYRWLIDHMNAFAARRPRQFLSAWWLPSNYVPGAGNTGTKSVGRFKFLSSGWGGPRTKVRIGGTLPLAGDQLDLYLDGALWFRWDKGAGWGDHALAGSTLGVEHELEVRLVRTVADAAPTILGFDTLHILEDGLVPALPGGQTVPATFPSFAAADAQLDARESIVYASQRADLVKGMIWLWANRRRWLVARTAGYGYSFVGQPYLLSSAPASVAREVLVHRPDVSGGVPLWTRSSISTTDTELSGSELPAGNLVEERFPAAP